MTHGPEHHVEHAEHAAHAAHDPFDRQVTMSIAIVAAFLACATMLSHRAHNATLQLQVKANDTTTLAFNEWSQYQAKRQRQEMQQVKLDLVDALNPRSTDTALPSKKGQWQEKIDEYKKETKDLETSAQKFEAEAKGLKDDAHHMHELGNYYDVAELGIEIALVLCSIAVLTKKRPFWYSGMTVGILGVVVMLYAVSQQFLFTH